jgi:hypothetical protein
MGIGSKKARLMKLQLMCAGLVFLSPAIATAEVIFESGTLGRNKGDGNRFSRSCCS